MLPITGLCVLFEDASEEPPAGYEIIRKSVSGMLFSLHLMANNLIYRSVCVYGLYLSACGDVGWGAGLKTGQFAADLNYGAGGRRVYLAIQRNEER